MRDSIDQKMINWVINLNMNPILVPNNLIKKKGELDKFMLMVVKGKIVLPRVEAEQERLECTLERAKKNLAEEQETRAPKVHEFPSQFCEEHQFP